MVWRSSLFKLKYHMSIIDRHQDEVMVPNDSDTLMSFSIRCTDVLRLSQVLVSALIGQLTVLIPESIWCHCRWRAPLVRKRLNHDLLDPVPARLFPQGDRSGHHDTPTGLQMHV